MKLFSKNQSRTFVAVRNFVVVPAALALTVTLAACDGDQDPAAGGTDTSSAAAGESGDVAGGRENGGGESGSTDTAASSAARVKNVAIEDFEVGDGYYSFLLEDGQTVCTISGGETPLSGLGCFVELEDAPFDPANSVPVSLFEMTPEGAAGLTTDMHTIDRTGIETLKSGQRIEVDGISCTALGGSDFSCEANGREVVFEDGKTPDIPVVSGGAGSIQKSVEPGSGGAGSSSVKTAGKTCGQVTVGSGDRSLKTVEVRKGSVDCDEILPIVEEYLNTPADSNYGGPNTRTYGDWTCAIQNPMQAQKNGYDVSCGTIDGRAVGVLAK
ncbi:hypothetical protein [Corynebacterium xerosis]|uniref:hypothetical protein n=1 Tax=Corynebacterium xerosis TaxID=1725 RepID=UPI0013CEB388|nr:hypothetical protein [Corynebacterium xerosis]